jgi:GAF domain-containing protein
MSNIVGKFDRTLQADGLRAAMRWLNDRVPYRFTAIFAFDGDMLRNICLIDKENESISNCSDQSITESYCMYVHRSREMFSVEETLLDSRVAAHPKRKTVQCYYGIPLFGSEGELLGTVCHFDYLPIRVTEGVASGLDNLAPLIAAAAFSKKAAWDPLKRTENNDNCHSLFPMAFGQNKLQVHDHPAPPCSE